MILQADQMWSPGRLLMSLGGPMRLPGGSMISLWDIRRSIDDTSRSFGELQKKFGEPRKSHDEPRGRLESQRGHLGAK